MVQPLPQVNLHIHTSPIIFLNLNAASLKEQEQTQMNLILNQNKGYKSSCVFNKTLCFVNLQQYHLHLSSLVLEPSHLYSYYLSG